MDFAPPSGPPPPKAPIVPEGWKAQYNGQYSEWFYVNIYTKKSQWEMPTKPVYDDNAPPSGPPPGYAGAGTTGDKKHNPYEDHSASPGIESDAALAARLQAEEDARGHGSSSNRTAMQDYQNTPIPGAGASPSYSQQALPQREEKSRGLFSKLLGKASGGSSSSSNSHSYPQQPQYGQQQHYGGGGFGGQPQYQQQGYPQQGYGGYGGQPQYQQQGYGGGGYGGGYAQPKKSGGGMGMAGGAALGVGGGLIGGMLIADAMEDHDQNEYQQGYDAGQDNGGGGDDFGGGDDGGGDF